jgi:hypothetical protein
VEAAQSNKATEEEILHVEGNIFVHTWAVGVGSWFCDGTLTLDREALCFTSDLFPGSDAWAHTPLDHLVSARVGSSGATRRRAVWFLGGVIIPVWGWLGLIRSRAFWRAAAQPALEVSITYSRWQDWLYTHKRVFLVREASAWANAINAAIEDRDRAA